MSSAFDLTPRPVLGGKALIVRDGISLMALSGGHVIHALGQSGDSDLGGSAIRTVAPGQYFIVGDAALTPADVQALAERLKTSAELVDQSHGRVRLLLRGANAEMVLAKGTAVDLAHLAIGQSASTLLGHIGAHITRMGDDSFEIIVLRSFAESLWDDLDLMSREFSRPANR